MQVLNNIGDMLPMQLLKPADFLKGMVKTLSDSKTALQNKDASMFLSALPDENVRTKIQDMLKGLISIDKDGEDRKSVV